MLIRDTNSLVNVGMVVEWSKAHVWWVLILGYQAFEPWFQLELESDWEVAKKGFPFQGFFWLQVGDMWGVP